MQGVIAISQFTTQQSFFKSELLRKLTGESLIGADISGVAKFVFEGQKIVRSYGTFPHPNVLGGFLILTILITILLYLESKNGYLSSKLANYKLFSSYDNTKDGISQGIICSLFWIVIIFIQISALFLTFSRISWFSFILAVIILLIISITYLTNVSRETLVKNTIIKFKELFIVILLLIVLTISNFSIIQARIGDNLLSVDNRSPNNYALSDRLFYNNVSNKIISNNPFFGSGLGTFVFQIDGYLEENNINQKLEPWQYQPAHNIYFLIASEIGIIGLLFFLLFLIYTISISLNIVSSEIIFNRRFNYYLLTIFLSFLFIGLFDHYFWTLQQGRLIFWLVLGFMLVNNNKRK
ncbi:MAG: O-antigen ligase family protein [Candidatus Pacebacteria bacterium]|nr:O-antigen ligase family protein [Candidatus Paceibacterota bacterium]